MMYTCQKLGVLTVCCFQLLEDKNGEVQNLAVRCLGPLVGKVKEYQVEGIVDSLGRTRYQFFFTKHLYIELRSNLRIRRLCDLKFDFEIFLNFLIQTGYFNDNIQKLKSKHYRNNGAKATVVDPML